MVVMIDTNILSDISIRENWTNDYAFLMNSPPKTLKIKIGFGVWDELVGAENTMPADQKNKQLQFVETYRKLGKILIDHMPVSLFSPGDRTTFDVLNAALAATNLSKKDARTAADGLVNGIHLLTSERRLREGVAKAIKNKHVLAILRRQKLNTALDDILTSLKKPSEA